MLILVTMRIAFSNLLASPVEHLRTTNAKVNAQSWKRLAVRLVSATWGAN